MKKSHANLLFKTVGNIVALILIATPVPAAAAGMCEAAFRTEVSERTERAWKKGIADLVPQVSLQDRSMIASIVETMTKINFREFSFYEGTFGSKTKLDKDFFSSFNFNQSYPEDPVYLSGRFGQDFLNFISQSYNNDDRLVLFQAHDKAEYMRTAKNPVDSRKSSQGLNDLDWLRRDQKRLELAQYLLNISRDIVNAQYSSDTSKNEGALKSLELEKPKFESSLLDSAKSLLGKEVKFEDPEVDYSLSQKFVLIDENAINGTAYHNFLRHQLHLSPDSNRMEFWKKGIDDPRVKIEHSRESIASLKQREDFSKSLIYEMSKKISEKDREQIVEVVTKVLSDKAFAEYVRANDLPKGFQTYVQVAEGYYRNHDLKFLTDLKWLSWSAAPRENFANYLLGLTFDLVKKDPKSKEMIAKEFSNSKRDFIVKVWDTEKKKVTAKYFFTNPSDTYQSIILRDYLRFQAHLKVNKKWLDSRLTIPTQNELQRLREAKEPKGFDKIVNWEDGKAITRQDEIQRKRKVVAYLSGPKQEIKSVLREGDQEREAKVKLSELALKVSARDRAQIADFVAAEMFGSFGKGLSDAEWFYDTYPPKPTENVLPFYSNERSPRAANQVLIAMKEYVRMCEGDVGRSKIKINLDGEQVTTEPIPHGFQNYAELSEKNDYDLRMNTNKREFAKELVNLSFLPSLVQRANGEKPIILVEKQINTVTGGNLFQKAYRAIKLPGKYRQQSNEDYVAVETVEQARAYLKRQAFVELTEKEKETLGTMRSADEALNEPLTVLARIRTNDIYEKLKAEKVKADKNRVGDLDSISSSEVQTVIGEQYHTAMLSLAALRALNKRLDSYEQDVESAAQKLSKIVSMIDSSSFNSKARASLSEFEKAKVDSQYTLTLAEEQIQHFSKLVNRDETKTLNKADYDTLLKQQDSLNNGLKILVDSISAQIEKIEIELQSVTSLKGLINE